MSEQARAGKGRMAVVGLTGGIAAGKSTVAARMREHGVPVVDADLVAREVVEPGQPALARIRARFGDGVIREDGTLDRAALGARVFADPVELAALNAIVHPAIMQRVGERLVALRTEGHPFVVYEAALILENQLAPGLDALVVVLADPEAQVARLKARNGLGEAAARARLAAQTDNATRLAAADLVIENTGDVEALRARTDEVVEALRRRFGG